MFGFYNMVLRINATQQSFDLKMIPDEVLAKTLGGKGWPLICCSCIMLQVWTP